MRASLALLLFGALLAGCGGAGAGTGTTVLPPITAPGASGPETPLSASVFDDSIGVNTHMTYVAGAYNTDFAIWSPVLAASGIKHVRDAICPTFVNVNWCKDTESPRINQLANGGIKFDLLTSLNDPFAYVASYASTMGVGPAIEAYEGPNECDARIYCPDTWQSTEAQWQQQLYTLKSPGVTIIAPSMTSAAGYAALGNLAAYADVGNIHDFPANDEPEVSLAAPMHLQWAAAMTGSDPVWTTEDDYNTDPTYANNGVPQIVQERYLPRMLLEHLRLRIMRTYIYQLFDFGSDGGSNMGLLNADYTPKPAWRRLQQLMHAFADGGPAARVPLTYSMAGDGTASLDHVLFQRSDGTYMLAFWMAQPVYDPASRSVLPIAQESVTVSLPPSVSAATLTAYADNGVAAVTALSGSKGTFRLQARSLVSILEFHV